MKNLIKDQKNSLIYQDLTWIMILKENPNLLQEIMLITVHTIQIVLSEKILM